LYLCLMEDYRIKVKINEITREYYVVPIITDDRDNQYEVFCDDMFICKIWSELVLTGTIWRADHKVMRQEVVDLLGEGIEKGDL
jgi:hypothetical protein